MSSLGAVIFDLDGTLYSEAPMRRRMLWELMGGMLRHGPSLPRALQAYRREREGLRGESFGSGAELRQRHWELASRRSGVSVAKLILWVEEWMEQRPLRHLPACARPGLISTFNALNRASVPLGVFSDHPLEDKLAALGVEEFVQASCCATSPEVGAFKPDPRGFLLLAERLGVEPSRTLVVGDREDADGEGARKAGMEFHLLGAGRDGLTGLAQVLPLFGLRL